MSEARTEERSRNLLRRILPVLLAVMLVLTTGVLPAEQSHAVKIPTINDAALPARYSSGYNVYKCMDISNWQGALTTAQFKTLKSKYGITHVIIRVGYSTQAIFTRHADASYKKNINNAYAAGLKVGAYYYSQATSKKKAIKEANKTIKLQKNYKNKITLPVAFDFEFEGKLASKKSSGQMAANTAICKAYCEKIKEAGYKPMVYASTTQLNNYLNAKQLQKKYKIWAANFMRNTSHTTSYANQMYAWQYSDSGRFGTSLTNTDRVDLSYIFVKKSGKWISYSNGRYRYKQDGVFLKSQWLTLNGNKYYLDADGYRVTGYRKIGSFYYGFSAKGVMYKNVTKTIGGKKYKFLANGRSVLYTAKVVNVSDGKLAYRTGPSTGSSYTTKGYYKKGQVIEVVREKTTNEGLWVQAGNKYWSLSGEDGTDYLKKQTVYPQ